ncbi:carboxypeptidase regulatory-like domain-containing protein [Lutibacter sp. TH_r2]|uniref:carboxypeptidase regulatory-like domain-containing protein n=1 Tax=Lutibacter sp. TH_r2 TaxID=3082083 RepID=UPI002953DEE8|nr:carboxypeptidase regulatory-like domain-containing protein [Lutibacter sp. TH_r2]MDV7187604.1 carboxypeptidase regulatory-like domain-containing protein [Lutibacter sp. TH_r2]
MKNTLKYIILFSFSLFLGCSEDTVDLVGIGTITGRVVEAETFNPIENAKITLSPTNNATFTDADGYFTVEDVEVGEYSVSAEKDTYLTDYQAATVSDGIEVNVIFEMEDETALNRPPSAPNLVTPEDGSDEQELSIELIWESTDPDEDPIVYRLEIKNDYNDEVIAVEELSDTTYVVSDLKYGTKYFWQVAATDEINDEVLSAVSTFTTKSNPENRYFYVNKADNGNNVIYSADIIDEEVSNEVLLTSEDQNSWRPRKNQAANLIAFMRTYNNETHLFTMGNDGSNISQVTSSVPINGFNLNEIDFSWSSNGDRLLYPSYDKLYVINKDGSGLEMVYQTTDGSFITECDWSNDESMIALKTNNISGYNVSIFTIDIAGNVLNTVLSGVNGAAGGLNISINNKLLLYSYDVSEYEDASNRQLDTHVYIYNFEDNTTLDLSGGKDAGTNDLDPRFSPNEAEVIFVNTSNDGVSQKDIYTMTIEDDNEREQYFSNAFMPDWE